MATQVITDTAPEKPKPAVVAATLNGNGRHESQLRRFERPDVERHGQWLVPRFVKAFPHLSNHPALSFMVNVIYSNEFMFLYQPHGVALAQVVTEHVLQPEPIVWERFAFLEDPTDPRQHVEGAEFYTEFERWAKQKQAKLLVVEQQSDVPRDVIKERLGRIYVQETMIARV